MSSYMGCNKDVSSALLSDDAELVRLAAFPLLNPFILTLRVLSGLLQMTIRRIFFFMGFRCMENMWSLRGKKKIMFSNTSWWKKTFVVSRRYANQKMQMKTYDMCSCISLTSTKNMRRFKFTSFQIHADKTKFMHTVAAKIRTQMHSTSDVSFSVSKQAWFCYTEKVRTTLPCETVFLFPRSPNSAKKKKPLCCCSPVWICISYILMLNL